VKTDINGPFPIFTPSFDIRYASRIIHHVLEKPERALFRRSTRADFRIFSMRSRPAKDVCGESVESGPTGDSVCR
jgi:hypothetical protein